MRQDGLIDWVIETLGLEDGSVGGKSTPTKTAPLIKDNDKDNAAWQFVYSSVVGILLYLAGHTLPNIIYDVNCCARYMFAPNRPYALALKRIGRYLHTTWDKGLILNPSKESSKIGAYPDANVASLMVMKSWMILRVWREGVAM